MKMKSEFRALCVTAACAALAARAAEDLASYVDPFTGTAGTGHTHPSACVPFGMVQAGPDTGGGRNADWAYCSGYQYRDTSVLGYSQTHLSGTGCPDYNDVQLLPFAGELGAQPTRRAIDKATERAEPGYYSVVQPGDGVRLEYDEGWVNVRKSNTEPYLRLIVECDTAARLADWTDILRTAIVA